MANIRLTHRALRDIQSIHDYSIKQWGESRADQYLFDIESSLDLLKNSPKLLKINPLVSEVFVSYDIQKHWLICDIQRDDIFVLTVKHVSMNLLEILQDIQPLLEQEAEV